MRPANHLDANRQGARRSFTRRDALAAMASFAGAVGLSRAAMSSRDADVVAGIENAVGGRIGLAALDTASGRRLSHRADERFAMCSTFKLMLAAAVLSRVDSGSLRLEQPVSFARSDILPTSPIGDAHPDGGAEPLSRMLESLVEASDNTAANRLLALIDGPAGYTAYLRSIGDVTTRLDRVELDLNSNLPDDVRDTTTPNAMVEDMRRVLLGDRLLTDSRARLPAVAARMPDGARQIARAAYGRVGGRRQDWHWGARSGQRSRNFFSTQETADLDRLLYERVGGPDGNAERDSCADWIHGCNDVAMNRCEVAVE
jgi:beta-lactamase class A